ncbi:hypothetical protein NW766_003513 [Fusarium irregulare]|uniref:WD40 repeat-like protein n=1 Tax=Fusarium irregulare TaxID=2494466 RepID=A0A9W8UE67_9HYPO|nr:hypothetical protein NW766_003513 [Fusarium irregulare]
MGGEAKVDAEQDDSDGERSETSSTRPKSPENYSGHSDALFGLCYSPGQEKGNYLASGSDDGTARIWSLETRKTVVVLKHHGGDVNSVSFSADGRLVATASSDNTIAIWNQESPGNWGSGSRSLPVQILPGHSSMIWPVNFAPHGHRLVSSANDSQARVWVINVDLPKAKDSEQKVELEQDILWSENSSGAGRSRPVICVSASPDDKVIASGCRGGKISLWDATTGAHLRTMKDAHIRPVASLVFSEDGETLVSTSWDGSAIVWNVDDKSTTAAHHLKGHEDWVRGAAISSNKAMVATACDDRAVRGWDISASLEPTSDNGGSRSRSIQPRVFQGHRDYVFSVAFSRDGRYLASGGDDGIVMFWDLSDTGDKEKSNKEVDDRNNRWWRRIVFTPDGNTV